MRILVIGSGGREHALVWKLAQSRRVTQLWCTPGNGGISMEVCAGSGDPVRCESAGAEDVPALVALAHRIQPDLTVVGPDNPLAMGVVDLFRREGFSIWGPSQSAARFESSKAFSQEFMARHGIPTAQAGVFDEPGAARDFAATLGGRCAVKADGLALGKGVLLCQGMTEAATAIEEVLVRRAFGGAGRRVVIQEWLEGVEVSLHALVDGTTWRLFPSSQDHKRALDGDRGMNTGGMGSYSPAPFLGDAELAEVGRSIMDPWMVGCAKEGIDYCGILYPGLMLTRHGPKVLEFNARFGDPETQVYLPRLENDLVDVLEACVTGRLDQVTLRWRPECAVCVVMASQGYPGSYAKGKRIEGLKGVAEMPQTKVFHAGTRRDGDEVVTQGGRVLGVTAWRPTLQAAVAAAYVAVEGIAFEGAHWRRDIGHRGLEFSATTRS